MTDVEFARFAGLSAWLAAAMRDGQQDRMAQVGGLTLLVASLVFRVWSGALLLGGGLTIPARNA